MRTTIFVKNYNAKAVKIDKTLTYLRSKQTEIKTKLNFQVLHQYLIKKIHGCICLV